MRKTAALPLAAAVLALAALTGCGTATQAHVTAHSSTVTTGAASPAASASMPSQSVPASTSPMDAWCAGTGYSDYQAVQSDITQMSTDVGNGNLGTAENADAATLNAAAMTALRNPPPGTRSQKLSYVEYMGAVAFAAIDLESGNITAAEKAMTGAAGYRDKVDAIVAACG